MFKINITNFFKKKIRKNRNIRKVRFAQQMVGDRGYKQWIKVFFSLIFLICMTLIICFPFYWMVITSFKTDAELDPTKTQSLWPKFWTFEWYNFLLKNSKISVGYYLFNSFLVAFLSTIFKLIVSSFAAFALANFRTKFREFIFIILLSTLMIPSEAVMIGQYLLMLRLTWDNTLEALIIPFIGSAFTIFMLRQAFEQIPQSLVNASKIDGLSTFKFFWKIALPLIKPVLLTSALISFILSWNAVLWPVMVLERDSKWVTLPMLLWELIRVSEETGTSNPSELRDPQHLKMAGAVLSVLPMIILYIFTKKRIINSIVKGSSGIKG